MSVAGPNTAGTGADDASVGSQAWGTPGNITASDDTRTTVTVASGQTSHYLRASNFGFSIPAGATINGVKVEWERQISAGSGIIDSSVKLHDGTSVVGNEKSAGAAWTVGSDVFDSFGGSADTWGATLTPTIINGSGFGAVLSAGQASLSGQAAVDSCRITVTYTASGTQVQRTMTGAG